MLEFNEISDPRGSLVALENSRDIPFDVKRVYYTFANVNAADRGFHAHINLKQVAICLSGSCTMYTESKSGAQSYELASPSKGLYMEGLVWREIRDLSEDTVLLVLADAYYTEDDYLRNYDDFKACLTEKFQVSS